jgi:hypothetical protein
MALDFFHASFFGILYTADGLGLFTHGLQISHLILPALHIAAMPTAFPVLNKYTSLMLLPGLRYINQTPSTTDGFLSHSTPPGSFMHHLMESLGSWISGVCLLLLM